MTNWTVEVEDVTDESAEFEDARTNTAAVQPPNETDNPEEAASVTSYESAKEEELVAQEQEMNGGGDAAHRAAEEQAPADDQRQDDSNDDCDAGPKSGEDLVNSNSSSNNKPITSSQARNGGADSDDHETTSKEEKSSSGLMTSAAGADHPNQHEEILEFSSTGGMNGAAVATPEIPADDGFDAFQDAAALIVSSQQQSEAQASDNKDNFMAFQNAVAGDDSFGAFDDAVPSQSDAPEQKTLESEDDSFRTFEAVPAEPDSTPTNKTEALSQPVPGEGDDSFGAFGEAVPKDEPEPLDTPPQFTSAEAPSQPEKADDEDLFGAFGVAAEPETQPTTEAPSQPEEGPKDDSFGDFGEAVPSQPHSLDATLVTEVQSELPQTDVADGDDSFGAFGEAAPAEQDTLDTTQNIAAPSEPETKDEDDSFGAFGEAVPTEGNISAPTSDPESDASRPNFGEGDDSFGAFGEAAPEEEDALDVLPVEGSQMKEPKEDDDDLGNFEVAQTEPGADNPDNGDDFGDFAAADTEAGDEDFGDFDAPPPSNEAKQSDQAVEADDGDFGDFDEAPQESSPPPTARATSSDADPVMKRVRSVFPNLFSQYRPAESVENDAVDSVSEEMEAVSIQNVLVRLEFSFLDVAIWLCHFYSPPFLPWHTVLSGREVERRGVS